MLIRMLSEISGFLGTEPSSHALTFESDVDHAFVHLRCIIDEELSWSDQRGLDVVWGCFHGPCGGLILGGVLINLWLLVFIEEHGMPCEQTSVSS